MTRDDIIGWMQEVGAKKSDLTPQTYDGFVDLFQRFAALVAAEKDKEIERLRKVLKKLEYFSDGTIRQYPDEHEVEVALRQEQPK